MAFGCLLGPPVVAQRKVVESRAAPVTPINQLTPHAAEVIGFSAQPSDALEGKCTVDKAVH